MKKLIYIFSILLFISCSSNDDYGTPNENDPNQVTNLYGDIVTDLPVDMWLVTSFENQGEDQTQNFESFQFDFDVQGNVIGQNDLFSESGTWNYSERVSNEESETLTLDFNETEPFDALSETWDIISASETTVVLEYNSNSISKSLTFTKE